MNKNLINVFLGVLINFEVRKPLNIVSGSVIVTTPVSPESLVSHHKK